MTSSNLVQSENAYYTISVTDEGISIRFIDVQSYKKPSVIEFIVDGNVTCSNEEQLSIIFWPN